MHCPFQDSVKPDLVIAYGSLVEKVDAYGGQPLADIRRVGVDDFAQKQLCAD